jgi:GDPmannose 4,6-dehydratase
VACALITGITGQDGQYLAALLHERAYTVFGLVKGQANPKAEMLQRELPFVEIINGDLQDLPSLVQALELTQPDEVYNLGAISFVHMSFTQAELTANITGLGVLRLLEAIRMVGGSQGNPVRFYQASSSEMFGKVRETPQSELTPFHPRSPYGCAKVFGHDITVNYTGIVRSLRVRHPLQPRERAEAWSSWTLQDHQRAWRVSRTPAGSRARRSSNRAATGGSPATT